VSDRTRAAVHVFGALLLCGAAFAGCTTDDGKAASSAAGVASGVEEDGAVPVRTPTSTFDAGVSAEGSYCSLLVAAECDGNEDCPGGQVCCGTLDGGAGLRYSSIKCQESCEAPAGGRQICHPGDPCPVPGDGGLPEASTPSCRRSLILPPYLAVCTTPNPLLPNELVGQPAAPNTVNCGETLTCGAGMKCCVLGSWDAATRATTLRAGYCAPVAEDCDCANAPAVDGG